MDAKVNVAIIGAGPAGISAGIYLQRTGLAPLLIEKGVAGGLLRSASLVENYPGFPEGISGQALVRLFSDQLRAVGLQVTSGCVERVDRLGGSFRIKTDSDSFVSRSVIVSSGTRPADLQLRGARALMGTRVFDEITDIPRAMRRGGRAIVIGGGDAAFDYALSLRASGDEVTIASRSKPRCLSLLKERAEARGVQLLEACEAASIAPLDEGVNLICKIRGARRELEADLVLLACGRTQNLGFLSPTLRKKIGKKAPPETAVPGFYLAGDVARGNHRQTGIAVGDGIRAAMLVQDLFRNRRGSA